MEENKLDFLKKGFCKSIVIGLALCLFVMSNMVNSATNTQLVDLPNEKISLNFQKAPVPSLLQLIAKAANLNIVISDEVKGDMTLHLQDVSWKEAMNVILKSNGLGYRRVGNTLLVAPMDELAAYELKEMQANQKLATLVPLKYRIITLKYANTGDMAKLLKSQDNNLLSSRGQIGEDPRTNSLIVYDTEEHLNEIQDFIKQLDKPAKQVLIQVRIVNIDDQYERELGARFGITYSDYLSGTLAGANQLAQGTRPAFVTPLTDRLNFNQAATNLFGQPASVGLALAKLGNVFLDLELSAMEKDGTIQIVSSPRIVTANQQTATIQQGEEIPYQEASSSGATSVSFKNAVLSMDVTPQITADNKIMLNVKVTENKRGQQVLGATEINGEIQPSTLTPPAIDTQEMESNVLLNNKESVVIGGIYRQIKGTTIVRVPFLGSIPIIGWLFRNKQDTNSKRELLVFITPTILNNAPRSFNTPTA